MKRLSFLLILITAVALCTACFGGETNAAKTSFTYWRKAEIPLENTPYVRELEKQTGVHLEFIYPRTDDEQEQLNLLYFSGNLPDIIETDWSLKPGGADEAIRQGYILCLDDLIDKYSPNLKKCFEENPELKKYFRSGEGYYVYPLIQLDEGMNVYGGLCIRSDWLQELGLSMPETLDDWHETLLKFRDVYHPLIPLALPKGGGAIMYAYHISNGFYIDNGEVYYGYTQPAYKEYLSLMNLWYREGLLGENYPNGIYASEEQMLIDGSCAALYGTMGRTMNSVLKSGASVEGAPYPVLRKGERPFSSQYYMPTTQWGAASISGDCADPAAAARFLDFGYSEEGKLLFNFGILGESYEMIDGKPVYTSLITDSISMNDTMNLYLRANDSGPFIQMKEYLEQYAGSPQQKRARERWNDTDASRHTLPKLHLTREESMELSQLHYSEYTEQMEINFITGVTPLSEFDEYLQKASALGAERALEIYRAVYARFLEE